MQRALTTLALLALAASVHAGGDLAPQTESAHFVHYARKVTSRQVGARERLVETLQTKLGVRLTQRVRFYGYEKPAEVAAALGRPLAGYYSHERREVHASPESEDHEIVHAVAFELGDPGLLFHEGLAIFLGNRGRFGGEPVDRVAKRILRRMDSATVLRVADRDQSFEGSAVAGSFVGWLVEAHGFDRVASFFRACRGGTPVAFEASFGKSLEAASGEWARALGVESPERPSLAVRAAAGP
jgi:hypothetical protein